MKKLNLHALIKISCVFLLILIAINGQAQLIDEANDGLLSPTNESGDVSEPIPPSSSIYYNNGSVQTFITGRESAIGNSRSGNNGNIAVYTQDFDSGPSGWTLTNAHDNLINCLDASTNNALKLAGGGFGVDRIAIIPGIPVNANTQYYLEFDYWTSTLTGCPGSTNCERPDAGDEMTVQYSTTGAGGPWTTLLVPAYTSGSLSHINIPLPIQVTAGTIHIRLIQFNHGGVGSCSNLGVDNHTIDNVCVNRPCDEYVIISEENMEIEETTIHSGGIGVLNEDEEAKIDDNSLVIAAGTFVKAPEIDVKDGSEVTVQIEAQADPNCMPEFLYNNTSSSNDVTVEEGETIILTESIYDDIEAEDYSVIIFQGPSNVYIEDFDVGDHCVINFDQCTNLRIQEEFRLGEETDFNQFNEHVAVFAEDKIAFEGRNTVRGIFYTLEELIIHKAKSYDRNHLTGQFIGREVDAFKYTDFYYYPFTPCSLPIPTNLIEEEDIAAPQEVVNNGNLSSGEGLSTSVEKATISKLKVAPNPFQNATDISFNLENEGFVSLEIYNLNGQLIDQLISGTQSSGTHTINWNGNSNDGNQLQNGIYFVILKTSDQVITKKVSLIK